MDYISVSEMRELEGKTFTRGVTVLELMERAGKECARLMESKIGSGNKILVFCGPGNNGGDGLVCARHLKERNDVTVVLPVEPKTEAAKSSYGLIENEVTAIGLKEAEDLDADIIVDALLGIGTKGTLRGEIKKACILINSMKGKKVSIDVPTGMDAETGECDPDSVRPDATICIHAPKTGEKIAGRSKTGELWIADIGLD